MDTAMHGAYIEESKVVEHRYQCKSQHHLTKVQYGPKLLCMYSWSSRRRRLVQEQAI